MNSDIRAAIYAILVALSAIAVGYGLVTQDEAALWLALATAILNMCGLLLARAHVTPDGASPPRRAQNEGSLAA